MSVPSEIGGYPVVEAIRTTAHGEILRGADGGGAHVEISVYRPGALTAAVDPAALRERARRVAELPRHESVLPLLAAGPLDDGTGAIYVVSRATDGPTLADVLRRGPLPLERAVTILRQVAEALDHVHAVHGVHGNVHPGAIHLPGGGAARLAPPALVARIPEERAFHYVAPEALRGGPDVPASDRYALGAVLFQALTGEPPHPENSPPAVAAASHEREPSLPPGERSAALDRLVLALLAKDPAKRPGDAARVLAEIEGRAPESRTPSASQPAGPAVRPSRRAPTRAPAPRSGASRPPAPVTPSGAPSVAPSGARRRRVGRLLLPLPGGGDTEAWDLLDDAVGLAIAGDGSIRTSVPESEGAVCRVRRTATGDVVEHVESSTERARVNGSLFDAHDLREGDAIEIAGRTIRYERARRREGPPREGAPAAPAEPAPRRGRRWIPVTAIAGTAILLVLITLLFLTVHNRGRDAIERAESIAHAPSAGGSAAYEAAQNRERHAREALAAALEYGETHPGDWEGRRARLRAVYREFSGTRAAAEAHDAYEGIAAEKEESVDTRFSRTRVRADHELQLGRLHAAYEIWQRAIESFRGTRFEHRCQRQADRVEEEIHRRFNEDWPRAQELIDAERLDAAIDLLSRIVTYGTPLLRTRAEKLIRRLEPERQAAEDRAAEKRAAEDRDDENAEGDGEHGEDGENKENGTTERDGAARERRDAGAPKNGTSDAGSGGEENEAAAALVDAAWVAARAGQWERVRAATKQLLADPAHGRGPLLARREIELLARLARLEIHGPRGDALHGAVTELGDGRLRLEYDFRDAKQALDWELVNPFLEGETGSFEVAAESGELRGRAAGAFQHHLVFEGPLDLAFEVKSATPHDLGATFFDPETPTHQLLFAVGNRVFTFGAEREKLHEHFIFVFGRGAWTKTQRGDAGYIRVARSAEPYLASEHWVKVHCRRDGDEATMVIAGTVLRGPAKGDDGAGFRDLIPALHVLATNATFRHVRIEGTPSRSWAEREKAKLREILGL